MPVGCSRPLMGASVGAVLARVNGIAEGSPRFDGRARRSKRKTCIGETPGEATGGDARDSAGRRRTKRSGMAYSVAAMTGWALDLGTTNSGVARWDEGTGQPQLVELADVCRDPERDDPLEAPRMVPSAVHLLEKPGLLDRVGSWPPIARRMFLGRRALIGRPALERNREVVHPAFVPTFKAALSSESTRPLARLGRRAVTAREVARAFLRELLVATKRATGERVRDLVVTSPVSAFETYRAEVQRLLQGLGVRRVRFVDEPVAAALGYGLSLSHERTVLVVDIGGGTMHVVLVALSPRGAMGGEARVLAKQGRPLGGNAVDGWVLEEACRQAGLPP